MVMGPMKAMSVMACLATRLNKGKVARANTDRSPARRLTKRDTAMYTPTSASSDMRQKGRRSAHSGRLDRAKVPGDACTSPNTAIDRLINQKVRTGLDQKTSGSMGEPGHHKLMKSPRVTI
jgi:hypothetical protein